MSNLERNSHLEQNTIHEDNLKTKNIRSMPVGNDRLDALKDLGATFVEGHHTTTKIATPSGTPRLPSFIDSSYKEPFTELGKSSRRFE